MKYWRSGATTLKYRDAQKTNATLVVATPAPISKGAGFFSWRRGAPKAEGDPPDNPSSRDATGGFFSGFSSGGSSKGSSKGAAAAAAAAASATPDDMSDFM